MFSSFTSCILLNRINFHQGKCCLARNVQRNVVSFSQSSREFNGRISYMLQQSTNSMKMIVCAFGLNWTILIHRRSFYCIRITPLSLFQCKKSSFFFTIQIYSKPISTWSVIDKTNQKLRREKNWRKKTHTNWLSSRSTHISHIYINSIWMQIVQVIWSQL